MGLKRRLALIREFGSYFRAKYVVGFEPPSGPLLDPETLAWVINKLYSAKLYLEFGCGGTTIMANDLGVPTISVESDRSYAAVVQASLARPSLTKIVTPAMGFTGPWGMPLFSAARKGAAYIRAPFEFLRGEFPELVVVDGRYRAACALMCGYEAANCEVPSQLLFDDYALRPHYHGIEQYLGTPQKVGRAAVFDLRRSRVQIGDVQTYATDPR